MVTGITMVGAILTNKSPVSLDQVTPIARLTGDPLVIVVPANSPHKTIQDLAAAVKADTAKVTWAGGSASGADHILAALFTKASGSDRAKVNYVGLPAGGEAVAPCSGGPRHGRRVRLRRFESQIKPALAPGDSDLPPASASPAPTSVPSGAGLDVEVVNWRAIMGAPGITPEQRKTLTDTMEEDGEVKGWPPDSQGHAAGTTTSRRRAPCGFLKEEQARVGEVLRSVGLVKS
jgi:putative tricarboxylic transport membrane protein